MFSADCRRCQPIREGGAAGRPIRGEETDKLVLQSGLFIISTWRAAGEGGGRGDNDIYAVGGSDRY